MRIIHTADWHIGLVSWRGSKITDRSEEIKTVLNELIEKSKRLSPDLIVVAGDIIHNKRNPNLKTLRTVLEALENLAKIAPTVVVLGNHDWEGLVTYEKMIRDLVIVGLGDYGRRLLDTNGGKIALYPMPYITGKMMMEYGRDKVLNSLVAKLKEFDLDNPPADYKIFVSHMMIRDMIKRPEEDLVSIEIEKNLIGNTFSYAALGHFHGFTKVSQNPPTYYSGSIIQVDFGETEEKGFVVVDIDGWNVDVRFEKLHHKKLATLDLREVSEEKVLDEVLKNSEGFDYVRIKISRKASSLINDLIKVEKVVSVRVEDTSENLPQISNFEDVESILTEYVEDILRRSLPDDKFERGMEIFRELMRRTTA